VGKGGEDILVKRGSTRFGYDQDDDDEEEEDDDLRLEGK
jgi:hypothetical protein